MYNECPKCGSEMQDILLTSYPPVRIKKCVQCGYEIEWKERQPDVAFNKITSIKFIDIKTGETILNIPFDKEYEMETKEENN